jgi:signal transduction histidine kinase
MRALMLTASALALTLWAASLFAEGGLRVDEWTPVAITLAWTLTGVILAYRRPHERTGRLVLGASNLGALALLGTAGDGRLAELVRPLAAALLPAGCMHVLLALPDGRLASRAHRSTVTFGYVLGAAVGVALWTQRPALAVRPLVLESLLAGAVGLIGSNARYGRSSAFDRQRMQVIGLGIMTAAEVVILAVAMRVLLGWPPHVIAVCAIGTLPVAAAVAVSSSKRVVGNVGTLLTYAISVAGLTGVVAGVYFVIVLGLGRVPRDEERTVLLLSMVAAAVAALLYLPARERLSRFANRLVYGELRAPDEALRTFGKRLSRAVPLDELLLQLAESLRKSLGLVAAEVWTGTDGRLERAVSDPDRGKAVLSLSVSELPIVARAGASGNAWIETWLPDLLAGRGDVQVRMSPITHSGELLGLIVAERDGDAEAFDNEEERVLTELARQVGLALHNVQLDSALQASLDELRRQADELRASRARIVAATDAERRRIERDLHDGAQQHLVALAVNLNVVRRLNEKDPAQASQRLEELREDLRDAIQELRDFAHGIYPPLLMDSGLEAALGAAAARSPVPTRVDAEGLGRYPQGIESAIYFCCLEALQNTGKYAGEGARATVRLRQEERGIVFDVSDDGVGFDMNGRGVGAGFTNMQDRLGAIGGSLRVESAPGAGTKLTGTIPLPR